MQKHAYLIMAHSEYEQLNLLIQMLDYPQNDIYVHIDKKSMPPDKELLCKNVKYSKVYIYSEISIYWGHFSQTECEIFLLEKATAMNYDYYHLISGADLPLCSQHEIHNFFEKNAGKEFVRYWGREFPEKCQYWISCYHPFQKFLRCSKKPYINKIYENISYGFVKLQQLLGINRIKYLNIVFQKGATWFSITHNLAELIIEKKEWIYKVFKSTRSSDEIFVQTILNNSHLAGNRAEKKYEIDGLAGTRYVDWKRGKPYTFTIEDYELLKDCGYLFARKFSLKEDSKIVYKLHEDVVNENHKFLKMERLQ